MRSFKHFAVFLAQTAGFFAILSLFAENPGIPEKAHRITVMILSLELGVITSVMVSVTIWHIRKIMRKENMKGRAA
jgi:uncharacterized membrane protein YbaN (DUF454 family)